MSGQPDIAGLGSDEIDADYVSELRTSRNRWRREAKDLRVENARLRAALADGCDLGLAPDECRAALADQGRGE